MQSQGAAAQPPTAAGRSGRGGRLVAALDIGGTKIAGALVDGDGRLVTRAQSPTPAGQDGATVMRAVQQVVAALMAHDGWPHVTAVGIGSAGPVNASTGTVSPVNVPGWRDFPLVDGVRAMTGPLPVTLTGDGVAIAAAEHWQGAARGYRNALCMVVSTGVGGGFVLGGVLHPGPTGNAGHIGHISVDVDGPLCPCGTRGCVERLASGPNITRYAVEHGWRPAAGTEPSTAAVAAAARAGDPVALAAFDRAAKALAAGIAACATLVEIEVAVIGGGVAGAGDVLFDPLRSRLREYATLSFAAGVHVTAATLGTDAGLVGAAAAAYAAADSRLN
ncbi:ROK family protein [Streptomyces sp. SL13]|uniref:ROK family protein n=1 Tax=Streptantibioticus silvisoli TaxID=2705255 RepID=A0AA90KHM9_9ACTN|nr:ROK family protein [Streptantibioticus silvisoli]MDI5965354.1 ROK family protein [Streptantibioticus silvisoli]MDI5972060.1 ROK family protein [Streptantibioticus silvisoli]